MVLFVVSNLAYGIVIASSTSQSELLHSSLDHEPKNCLPLSYFYDRRSSAIIVVVISASDAILSASSRISLKLL